MRKLSVITLVAGLAAAAAAAIPAFGATRTVRVDDNVFRPDPVSTRRGDTLRFRPAARPAGRHGERLRTI
jgi:hypothetical protein